MIDAEDLISEKQVAFTVSHNCDGTCGLIHFLILHISL